MNRLAVFISLSLCAGEKPWTVDALMALKTVHDPQITADGSKVAYVVREIDSAHNRYTSTIWIANNGQTHALPNSHYSDASPRWSPDGRQLAFLSRRSGQAQIHLESRQLSSFPTGIESFRWSPNGREIGFIAPQPLSEERRRQIESGDDAIVAGQGYRNSGIFILSVTDGRVQPIPINKHVLSVDWSPDGSKIVYAAQKSSRGRDRFHSDLYEFDLKANRKTPLVEQPGQDLSPSYSPDGRSVAFYSQRGKLSFFGERQVGIVPSGGGAIRYITETMDGDVFAGASKLWWSRDGAKLILGAGKGTSDYLFAVNSQTGKSERLPYAIAGTSSFSISADGSRIAWIRAAADRPPDLYLNNTQLSDLNPQLRDYSALTARTVHWRSKDGLEVEGVLRLPSRYKEGTRVPLLTMVHGGPTGVALENYPIPRLYPTQLFLDEGFAVFEPNFRGSINYGPKFRLPTIQQQGYGDMDDVMTGIDMLIEKGVADPDRLGIMGWSYGGYLSTWIVSHTTRFKAASIGACSMDWVTHYGAAVGTDDGPPEVVQEYFGGKPWDRFEAYERHSPRYFLKNIKTPSLLLRGEKDSDTIGELYLALTELNVPATFITYPREPHGIGEPAHQRDLLQRNLQWFKKWLAK